MIYTGEPEVDLSEHEGKKVKRIFNHNTNQYIVFEDYTILCFYGDGYDGLIIFNSTFEYLYVNERGYAMHRKDIFVTASLDKNTGKSFKAGVYVAFAGGQGSVFFIDDSGGIIELRRAKTTQHAFCNECTSVGISGDIPCCFDDKHETPLTHLDSGIETPDWCPIISRNAIANENTRSLNGINEYKHYTIEDSLSLGFQAKNTRRTK